MPLVLRGLLYLKVEVSMDEKDYKIMVDYTEVDDDSEIERIWIDTGDGVVELPNELVPYLQELDILGIA